MFDYIKQFFEIDTNPSSKRLVGIIAAIALVVYMFIYPSEGSNNSVLILALGSLGITSIEKIWKKQP